MSAPQEVHVDWAPIESEGDKLLFIFEGGHLDRLDSVRLLDGEGDDPVDLDQPARSFSGGQRCRSGSAATTLRLCALTARLRAGAGVDLHPARAGRYYDAFWDSYGLAGQMPVLAISVAELIHQLLDMRGARIADLWPVRW